MKVAPTYEVKNSLSRFIAAADDSPVIITKNGTPRAALVSLEGLDLEAFILGHTPRFLALLDRAAQQAETRGVALSTVERDVAASTRKPRGKAPRKRRK